VKEGNGGPEDKIGGMEDLGNGREVRGLWCSVFKGEADGGLLVQ